MPVYPYEGVTPQIEPNVLLCPGAMIVGRVKIGEGSSIWYNAVIRGDVHDVIIGRYTSIQDGALIHEDSGRGSGLEGGLPTVVGANETPDEYDYTYPDVDPDATKDQDKFLFPLPYGFVNVYMTQQAGDDFDPDFDIPDDVRPPSSSFTVGAEAYDSGIGYIIAAIMAGILAFWLVSMYSGNGKEETCR